MHGPDEHGHKPGVTAELAEAEALEFDEDHRNLSRRRDLISRLRREALDLKESYTRYCFQTVSISGLAYGAIFHFLRGSSFMGVAALALLPIVLVTSRMGANNYMTIHRNFGYELHLARVAAVPERFLGRWKPEYRNIAWEEAMRAWRIVQPTLFRTIHARETLVSSCRYHEGFEPTSRKPVWYCQESLLGPNRRAAWHPGSYLHVMQLLLYTICGIAAAIAFYTPLMLWQQHGTPGWHKLLGEAVYAVTHQSRPLGEDGFLVFKIAGTFAIAVVTSVVILMRYWIDRRRRLLLEDGILSIHACAMIWEAVVIAHFSAVALARKYALPSGELARLARMAKGAEKQKVQTGEAEAVLEARLLQARRAGAPAGAGLMGYTFWLGQEAASLSTCARNIHDWIGERRCAV